MFHVLALVCSWLQLRTFKMCQYEEWALKFKRPDKFLIGVPIGQITFVFDQESKITVTVFYQGHIACAQVSASALETSICKSIWPSHLSAGPGLDLCSGSEIELCLLILRCLKKHCVTKA